MCKNTYNDKIYWYNIFSGIVERPNVIIDRIEKIEPEVLEPGHDCYKIHYNSKYNLGECIMWIGKNGTGVELSGSRRYMVDDSGELDINRINTYLYNRKMTEVLDNL